MERNEGRPIRKKTAVDRLGVSISEVKRRKSTGGRTLKKKKPEVLGEGLETDATKGTSDNKSVGSKNGSGPRTFASCKSTSTVRKKFELDLKILQDIHTLEEEEDALEKELDEKDKVQRQKNTAEMEQAALLHLNPGVTEEEQQSVKDKLQTIKKSIDDRVTEQEEGRREFQRKKKAIERKKEVIRLQGIVDKCKFDEESDSDQHLGSDEELIDDVFFDKDIENESPEYEEELNEKQSNKSPLQVQKPPPRDRLEMMMARQTLKQDLPIFDGKAEEWPVFISQFKMTSEACGLTDVENLQRLQKSLKGPARETVRAMMVSADNVPRMMVVLEKRYGKPTVILDSILQNVRGMQNLRADDRGSMLQFVDSVRNLTVTAESFKSQHYINNPHLIRELVGKLPHSRQDDWGERQRKMGQEFPSMTDFSEWLEEVGDSISLIYHPPVMCSSHNPGKSDHQNHMKRQCNRRGGERVFVAAERRSAAGTNGQVERKCPVCSNPNHRVAQCQKFNQQSPEERWIWVKNNRSCFCCLNIGHSVQNCRTKRPCRKDGCQKDHHPLLHRIVEEVIPAPPPAATPAAIPEEQYHAVHQQPEYQPRADLMILPVKLQGPKGILSTYAMLDTGSTITLIDAITAEKLGLEGSSQPLIYKGLHPTTKEDNSKSVSLQIMDVTGEKKFEMSNVRTLGNLPLPYQSVKVSNTAKWPHLQGINFDHYENALPTILIGQDNANLTLALEVIQGPPNAPIAARTELGWVLTGRSGGIAQQQYGFVIHEVEEEIHQMVKHYFTTEAFGVKAIKELPRSKDDKKAIEIMESTSRRVEDRWEIGLLWKSKEIQLPESKGAAINRLRSTERKMDQNPEVSKWYVDKIMDYEQKGYVRKLTEAEACKITPCTWYSPHFVNYNPNKPDKPRLVFDAAAKVKGVSLNDNLMQGPDMVKPLPSVLFKFRQRQIGFTADIKEMFHQVRIVKEDRSSQRFLWRGQNRDKSPDTYELEVMFFGATSSPCSAQFIKNKNAEEYKKEFPEVYEAIVNRHYVDDYLDSSDTVSDGIKLINSIIGVHEKGGFKICNWTSNSREILQQIPEELRAKEVKELDLCPDLPTGRVLGLLWNNEEDCFVWRLCFHKVKKEVVAGIQIPTKRDVLKFVMSLFDPLGFIANTTVKGKILLQEIWRVGIGWDDEIPVLLFNNWKCWLEELQAIIIMKIPRCYGAHFYSTTNRQLHVFCDASEQAFCAVSYWRIEGDKGIEVAFVTAKTHVAPLKTMSIPRLELQAAVMATRLSKTVTEEHSVPVTKTIFWSDSTTVLSWLRADGKKFLQFVAQRVGEVQESSDPSQWRWIPTKQNVADEGTRDNSPSDLSSNSRWLNGPDFLKKSEEHWPKEGNKPPVDESIMEMKQEFVGLLLNNKPLLIIENYSKWTRLIRVTAWILRFVSFRKPTGQELKKLGEELTVEELTAADCWWWRRCQADSFGEEIECLKLGKQLRSESSLANLSPMLDEHGILRIKGRLMNRESIHEDYKCPVILPTKHTYTRLLIAYHHELAGHHGMERVVNSLRQKFHIIRIRVAVRSAWNNCQKCKNTRAKPATAEMGNLPECRLNSNVRPFTVTGVDNFGPIGITVRRSHEKRYGVLFTCMSTRAIHLELAGSLTTDSCIMAMRRFMARRGEPREMWSDNGTNFKGANNELIRSIEELNQKRIKTELSMKSITWHFIPPLAPHMGGAWERLVKATKVALQATLKEQYPREETLITLLAEAEHTVNSRPLTHVSIDPADDEALTPNHFLIGSSGSIPAQGVFNDDDLFLRRQWRISQRYADKFWQRWLKEFLPTLTRRTKWNKRTDPIKVGDVVIVADDALSRNMWPKGVITDVFPGRDGQVRVVEVKTSSGSYRRPITKICVLDVLKEGEDAAASAPGGAMLLEPTNPKVQGPN